MPILHLPTTDPLLFLLPPFGYHLPYILFLAARPLQFLDHFLYTPQELWWRGIIAERNWDQFTDTFVDEFVEGFGDCLETLAKWIAWGEEEREVRALEKMVAVWDGGLDFLEVILKEVLEWRRGR